MTKVTVIFEAKDIESAIALVDAVNEFGRHPDIDELLTRTTNTPSEESEGDWTIEAEGVL